MPPPSQDPQSQVRYFIKLLAALCLQGGGDLAIDLKYLRQIDEEGTRQALVEETDCTSDTLVLRYGSKHSAMYPVEPACQTQPSRPPSSPSQSSISPPVSQPRRPLTDSDLAKAERKIQQIRMAARVRKEQPYPREETLEEIIGQQ